MEFDDIIMVVERKILFKDNYFKDFNKRKKYDFEKIILDNNQ